MSKMKIYAEVKNDFYMKECRQKKLYSVCKFPAEWFIIGRKSLTGIKNLLK